MGLGILGAIKQRFGFLLETLDLVFEDANLVLKITPLQLVNIDNIVPSMLPYSTSEANTAGTIFAEALDFLAGVVEAAETDVLLVTFLVLLTASSTGGESAIASVSGGTLTRRVD